MDRLRASEEEELGAGENIFIVFGALQRGRLRVPDRLKNEAFFEERWNWGNYKKCGIQF